MKFLTLVQTLKFKYPRKNRIHARLPCAVVAAGALAAAHARLWRGRDRINTGVFLYNDFRIIMVNLPFIFLGSSLTRSRDRIERRRRRADTMRTLTRARFTNEHTTT